MNKALIMKRHGMSNSEVSYNKHARRELFRSGSRAMKAHRPDVALSCFRAFVDRCPTKETGDLARGLYWLGIALLQVIQEDLAVKSFASAQKLRTRGYIRKMYKRHINGYGLRKRPLPALDDMYAFISIHSCMYLRGKKDARYTERQERDDVNNYLRNEWEKVTQRWPLTTMSIEDKVQEFYRWPIDFQKIYSKYKDNLPFKLSSCTPREHITIDFRRAHVVHALDRCPCGSGLTHRLCCGRLQSPKEICI